MLWWRMRRGMRRGRRGGLVLLFRWGGDGTCMRSMRGVFPFSITCLIY